eukprot:683625-Alexandrium_andersonii.AAC.1
MSASLVGSEMCIRDRRPLRKRIRQLTTPPIQIRGAATYGFLHRKVGLGPVSYTHLTLPTICSV